MKKSKTQYQESLPIYPSDRRQLKEQLEFINFNINKSCHKTKKDK